MSENPGSTDNDNGNEAANKNGNLMPNPADGAEKGTSLGADAWKRLRANAAAVASIAVLVAICLFCIAGPWFTGFDPSAGRPWVGAQAPGFERPDALPENRARIGEPPELAAASGGAQTIEVFYSEANYTDYRVSLRRGKVDRIQQVAGATLVTELKVDATASTLNAQNEILQQLPQLALKRGVVFPAELLEPKQRVVFIRVYAEQNEQHAIINLSDYIVQRVRINDEDVEQLAVKGDSVLRIVADGAELTQYHLLGTDMSGRDLLTRIAYGGRISLLVGIVATAVSLIIGVIYGALSGYIGGRVDRILMAAIDILYAIPFIFLVILLLVYFGKNLIMLFIALGAVQWLTMARIVRGQALSLRRREFVEAAIICGASHGRIIGTHILPNCLGPIIVYTTLTVPAVILQESFLAFIGLQVQWNGQSLDSWGALVQQGMTALDRQAGDRWWMLVFPSIAMALTLLALNIVGDGLRDAFDPKLKGKT